MESFVFPGNIEPEISLIASRPIPYMRTAAFSAVVKSSEQMLLHLIGCPNGKVIFYTASGTGAMDAVVANYVSRYKKIFIISGGSFGDRWKNICDYYNLSSTLYKIPFAKDINYEDLEKKVASERPEIFLCQPAGFPDILDITLRTALASQHQDFLNAGVCNDFHLMLDFLKSQFLTMNVVVAVKSAVHTVILAVVCNVKRCEQIHRISEMLACLDLCTLCHALQKRLCGWRKQCFKILNATVFML